MANRGNVVFYLDKELVEKSHELGFNLSKTFENHLKHLITQFSQGNSVKNFDSTDNEMQVVGLPGFEPESIEPMKCNLLIVGFLWYITNDICFLFRNTHYERCSRWWRGK